MSTDPTNHEDPVEGEKFWEVDYSPLNDPDNPVPHVTRYSKSGRPVLRVWGVSDPSIFDGDDEEDTEETE